MSFFNVARFFGAAREQETVQATNLQAVMLGWDTRRHVSGLHREKEDNDKAAKIKAQADLSQAHLSKAERVAAEMCPFECVHLYASMRMRPFVCVHLYASMCMRPFVCVHLYASSICMRPFVCLHLASLNGVVVEQVWDHRAFEREIGTSWLRMVQSLHAHLTCTGALPGNYRREWAGSCCVYATVS